LERLREEGKIMHDRIGKLVAEKYPKFKVSSSSFSDPAKAGIGRRGQYSFDSAWIHKQALYSISVTVLFDPEDASTTLRRSMKGISMGEFYPAPDVLGKSAVLVKNVNYNKSMTNVGLHFSKGRMVVSTYLNNHKKTTANNEKDLVDFVKQIEQVLNAASTLENV
jgi:hypothetical protein